jgi:hypothetical protein
MSVVNFDHFVSLKDAARSISLLGDSVSFILEGEPGIGKSSVLKLLAEMHDDKWRKPGDFYATDAYEYVYLDCPTLGEGSLAMDIPDRDTKMLEVYTASRLKLSSGKPVIIMLDEYLKVPKLLKVLFTRLILERAIGDETLPSNSKVFGTSNLSSDSVNDTIEAHVGNRITRVKVAKPTAKQWNLWATDNGISALVRAWVDMNPKCMASYLEDGESDNPYIFNPRRAGAVSFVTPRSLDKANSILNKKSMLGEKLTRALLCGTVGTAAGESMMTFAEMEKDIILYADIVKSPESAPVPRNTGALLMTLFHIVDKIDTQDDLASIMSWVDRIPHQEIQGVFFSLLVQSKRTARLALTNSGVSKWAQNNFELLSN